MKALYPTIDKERLIELISGPDNGPFLIVFTAAWLGEGTILDEIIRQLSKDYQEVFAFYRFDIDASKDITSWLDIGRLPAIFFFQNGEMKDQINGLRPRHSLQDQIEAML